MSGWSHRRGVLAPSPLAGDLALQLGIDDAKAVLRRELDAQALIVIGPEHLECAPLLGGELEGGKDAVAPELMNPDLAPAVGKARPPLAPAQTVVEDLRALGLWREGADVPWTRGVVTVAHDSSRRAISEPPLRRHLRGSPRAEPLLE
jgi:hypothetical protein